MIYSDNNDLLSPTDGPQWLDPDQLLSLLPIRHYEVVGDIGCGQGFFTVPLGKYLRDGKLYALEIDDGMVDECQRRVEDVHLSNVDVLHCGKSSFPVPPGSLDGELLAFVINETDEKDIFMKAAADLLRPGGWCMVLEWYRRSMDDGPPLEHRVSRKHMRRIAENAGLVEKWVRSINLMHYAMLFMKRTT